MEALDILANDEHGVVLTWRGASVMARLWIIPLSYDGNLKRENLRPGTVSNLRRGMRAPSATLPAGLQ